MAGEPEPKALSEARLSAYNCDNYNEAARVQAEARIKQMRAEVDQQLKNWAEAQPGCWEEYRWQA
jgi:hypothetical protein